MYNKSEVSNNKSDAQERLHSFKKRMSRAKKGKLFHPEPIDTNYNHELLNFDPKAELKAKIIKAILTSSQAIQIEMDYKKNEVGTFTPKSVTTPRKNFKINLNRKYKLLATHNPHDRKDIESNRDCTSKYDTYLEIAHIMRRQNHKKLGIQQQQNYQKCESERNYRYKNNLRRSSTGEYRRGRQSKTHSLDMRNKNKSGEHLQIKPWISNGIIEKQFQYF